MSPWEEYVGCVHEWVLLAPSAPESVAAIERAGTFLRSIPLGPPAP